MRKTIFWGDILEKSSVLFLASTMLIVAFVLWSVSRNPILPLFTGIMMVLFSILVTRTISFPGSSPMLMPRSAIEFSAEEKRAVISGAKRVHTVPMRSKTISGMLKTGAICDAYMGVDRFGTIRVTDIKRSLLRDIAENDIKDAAFRNNEDFLAYWEARYRVVPNELVVIIRFTVSEIPVQKGDGD